MREATTFSVLCEMLRTLGLRRYRDWIGAALSGGIDHTVAEAMEFSNAGYSSVGRASDCRLCRYQRVPGSIPGGRTFTRLRASCSGEMTFAGFFVGKKASRGNPRPSGGKKTRASEKPPKRKGAVCSEDGIFPSRECPRGKCLRHASMLCSAQDKKNEGACAS